jgi:hypothetical protein
VAPKRHSDRRAGKRAENRTRDVPHDAWERTIGFRMGVAVSYGKLAPEDLPAEGPTILHASMITRTELRFRAAEYFLALLKRHLDHETAVLFHLQAFLSAFRATRELLEKEGKAGARAAEFQSWFRGKRAEMDANGVRELVDLRNRSEHEPIEPPNVEFVIVSRHHKDGRIDPRLAVERLLLPGFTLEDPLRRFDEAMAYLRGLLVEAKRMEFLSAARQPGSQVTVGLRVLEEQADGAWQPHPDVKEWTVEISGAKTLRDLPDLR